MTASDKFSKIILGGNVFGWTIDEAQSLRLLDYAFEQGINSIDTADMYQTWVTGHKGGESEQIIGKWLSSKKSERDQIQIITKGGAPLSEGKKGLSATYIKQAVEDSLTRLNTDYIDVYFSHYADPDTPIEETLYAYQTLIQEGKIRKIGASNYTADQLSEALKVSQSNNLPKYEIFQPGYNLVNRKTFETEYQHICETYDLEVITYYSLAAGFLSGKYRDIKQIEQSPRKGMLLKYFNELGMNVLKTLDDIAARYDAQHSEIALAWILSKDYIVAPIASATSTNQIDSFIKAINLQLSQEDLALLDQASQW